MDYTTYVHPVWHPLVECRVPHVVASRVCGSGSGELLEKGSARWDAPPHFRGRHVWPLSYAWVEKWKMTIIKRLRCLAKLSTSQAICDTSSNERTAGRHVRRTGAWRSVVSIQLFARIHFVPPAKHQAAALWWHFWFILIYFYLVLLRGILDILIYFLEHGCRYLICRSSNCHKCQLKLIIKTFS